jgi:hypothetical protein
MGGLRLIRRMKSEIARILVSTVCFWLSATWSRAEDPGDAGSGPKDTSASKIQPALGLKLTAGRQIVAELGQIGLFEPTRAFYAGHMGKIYDAAMAVVSRNQQYMKLGDDERYLDPTTEAHESLHAMSSLIRRARGWSISQGYDVIYVGNGEFATVRVGPRITKGQVGSWLPRHVKDSEIVKTHMTDPAFRRSNVALILEELAYHLLDGKIGLENHAYMEQKLGIATAVTVPAAEWSVVALATATMLDGDPKGFRRREDRVEFNLLVKRLVEESVTVYSLGMNGRKYGLLANLSPQLRSHFTFLLTEDSRQARVIRDFAAGTFGKGWLPRLVNQIETARQATDSSVHSGIYNP